MVEPEISMVQSYSLPHPETIHTIKSGIKSLYAVTYLLSVPVV